MSREETIQMLAELKERNLPRATVENVFNKVPHGVTEEEANEVLKYYTAPQEKCLGGDHSLFFQWGLAHGQGFCSKCGFPATAYHYVETKEGQKRIEVILQPHPDDLSVE